MKILLVNKYLYPKGGDAVSTIATGSLLSSKGHEVIFWGIDHTLNPEYRYKKYFKSNIDLNNTRGIKDQAIIALTMLYSVEAKKKIEELVRIERPDIVHLNNFAHQISPSILHVFKKYKIPVVMTMHDYKLVCASYSMLSKNRVCELCKNGKYYNCFLEGCVKDSKMKSMLNTLEMYLHHRILHIYDLIDIYISPSIFLRDKLSDMGFKGKILNLPNFINAEDFRPQYNWQENSIVYFGRLSTEKGIVTLLEAIKDIPINLKIIGEGPIREALDSRVKDMGLKNVRFLGHLCREKLREEIRNSMFVVVPSVWYENYPFSVIEAFALGKPIIGAKIGGISELVKDNVTGLTFSAGDVEELLVKIKDLIGNPDKIIEMGKNARAFVEKELNAEKYYQKLIKIYENILTNHRFN